ncbi:phosphoserine phosphatase SerB [Demequina mangrovi]|uniref:phosphoserine phosphatase n=1 Tax=Demequina mangrovi TaxID=1043493 RepID=A0A1H7AW53_9MICO|nr:phosphoserine phosphatase SerB [Demequina mangrovi]SEJ69528.1 phosphoserine phosphatase [Demequina mangrovi]
MRLCVLDVDSTLITAEVIELIAARAGTRERVAEITERAMRGELDFSSSLAERVATLAGVPDTVFAEVRAEVEFTPGVRELIAGLQAAGWEVALVSGGFEEVVGSLASALGITRYRANRLEVADGRLTGRTVGPVIDRAAKAQTLREFAAEVGCPLEDAVAIGDGANDLDMMATAGLGIAWRAKPVVQEKADIALNGPSLAEALPLLLGRG